MSSRIPGLTAAAARRGWPRLGAHQRKAPRQHAVIGQRGEELAGAFEPRLAPVDQGRRRARGTGAQRIDPLAAAGDAHALGLRIGAQAGGEPGRHRGEAVAAALAMHPHALAGAAGEALHPLAIAQDRNPQRVRGQPRGDPGIGGMVRLGVGDERTRQTVGGGIEALARQRQQHVGGRQRAGRGAQLGAAMVVAARPRRQRPARQAVDAVDQLDAHRHRHFRRGGRRRRAAVGDEIDQRHVGLVADRGDQRDQAVGGGADHDLLVEGPEILDGAAAARDDEEVGPRNGAASAAR